MSNKTKKQLLLNLPYFIAGLVCTNLGEAWRIAEGADMSEKLLGFLSALGAAFSNPMPSLHPMDLLIGVCCGAGLRLAVYLVEAITEFEDAARLLAALRPDLVILDLNLPEISGFQICQELKNKTAIPILVLTSRDQVKDELQAFQLGADEYLTKPCRKDRLLARVSNILKRYEGRTNLIEGLDFLLDQQTYTLYIHNTSVVLPKNQGKLLVALLSGGDALVTTEQLCIALWGTTEYIDENALQVNLTRLKKTMSGLEMKQRIVAVRGMGYRLETGVAP